MTTIIRKDNLIASDSKYVNQASGIIGHVIYGGAKFFILPEQTAVVALTGGMTTPAGVTQLLTFSRAVVHALNLGEELPMMEAMDGLEENYTVMIATKRYTVTVEIKPDCRNAPAVTLANVPVVIGSGLGFIAASELYTPSFNAAALVKHVYSLDELSGGTVHTFDLNLLKDYPAEGDSK